MVTGSHLSCVTPHLGDVTMHKLAISGARHGCCITLSWSHHALCGVSSYVSPTWRGCYRQSVSPGFSHTPIRVSPHACYPSDSAATIARYHFASVTHSRTGCQLVCVTCMVRLSRPPAVTSSDSHSTSAVSPPTCHLRGEAIRATGCHLPLFTPSTMDVSCCVSPTWCCCHV